MGLVEDTLLSELSQKCLVTISLEYTNRPKNSGKNNLARLYEILVQNILHRSFNVSVNYTISFPK